MHLQSSSHLVERGGGCGVGISDMKFPAKNTLHILPKGYQEPHNEDYNETHIEIYVLPVIPLGQPLHMENKRNNI